jgi:ketosteroid isomerase-like protein
MEAVMTTQIRTAPLDVAALVTAIESRDADAQLAAYAENAEVTVIDHEHPPSNPLVVRGTEALRTHFADICSRDMTHKVTTAELSGDRLTIELACQYSDGTRVACLCVSGVQDGRIVWQRGLQAWDH